MSLLLAVYVCASGSMQPGGSLFGWLPLERRVSELYQTGVRSCHIAWPVWLFNCSIMLCVKKKKTAHFPVICLFI